jgi:hypothetical protein
MKTVAVAGLKFEVLTPEEEAAATKECEHVWEPATKEVVVNPAGEYVRGYGCKFVSVLVAEGRRCAKCGTFETGDSVLETSQGGIETILQHRSYRRTVCELLRELHAAVSADLQPKVESCLLMAKKMNDKLTKYCGTNWEAAFYNERGEFIG